MLSALIFIPLLAAVVIALMPRSLRFGIRLVALGATLLAAMLALGVAWRFDTAAVVNGFRFVEESRWISALGSGLNIHYHVGVDGLNLGLLVMGALVAFAATCVSWEINDREKEFYLLLMLMTGGILGAFASIDLFWFYFFHELALVPTFIMIGLWGKGSEKGYAAFQMTLYLSMGAFLALVGLILLYERSGAQSLDLVTLKRVLESQAMSRADQALIWPILLLGFGILVSLWPFHSWAPLGYASAPTATAMLHAGVLKKFGLYGLIRIGWPFMPEGVQAWMPWLVFLALGNILYCGLVAMRQKDLAWLVGYSSVAHMGFAFLGIACANVIGVTGAVVIMVAHGFLAALQFGLVGYLRSQTGTLEMAQLGGLAKSMPFVGTVLMMAMLAGCGLPGFLNFVGEVLVFFGAWQSMPWPTILAVWGGLILGGVYMLRCIRTVMHGALPDRWSKVSDANGIWRRLPFAGLIGVLLLLGCFPSLLVSRVEPAVRSLTPQHVLRHGRMASSTGVQAAATKPNEPERPDISRLAQHPESEPVLRVDERSSGPRSQQNQVAVWEGGKPDPFGSPQPVQIQK